MPQNSLLHHKAGPRRNHSTRAGPAGLQQSLTGPRERRCLAQRTSAILSPGGGADWARCEGSSQGTCSPEAWASWWDYRPPTLRPHHCVIKSLFTAVLFPTTACSPFHTTRQDRLKSKRDSLNRLNKTNESQTWQQCWNYQTRDLKIPINILRALIKKQTT